MTLTNTKTILRQIGAMGGSPGYLSDDAASKVGRKISIQQQRMESAWEKYSAALTRLGRPVFAHEVADECGGSKSAFQLFVRNHPERFNTIPVRLNGGKSFLIELRTEK